MAPKNNKDAHLCRDEEDEGSALVAHVLTAARVEAQRQVALSVLVFPIKEVKPTTAVNGGVPLANGCTIEKRVDECVSCKHYPV